MVCRVMLLAYRKKVLLGLYWVLSIVIILHFYQKLGIKQLV